MRRLLLTTLAVAASTETAVEVLSHTDSALEQASFNASCPHWLVVRMSPRAFVSSDTGEDNADAHMKPQVMGREVVVAITKGRLHFGPWEQIFYGEFDGRRRKRLLVKIIGD